MHIELILKRAGGTKVPMGETEYHFKPVSDAEHAPHVAVVEDEAHLARLLAIPEAYRIHQGSTKAPAPTSAPAATPAPSPTPAPTSAPVDEKASLVLKRDGEEVDLGAMTKAQLVAFAHDNGMTVDPSKKVGDLRIQIRDLATAE